MLFGLVLAWAAAIGAGARTHVVAQGDSLSELAERYGVDVEQLREWNGLEGDAIRIGQELRVAREGTVHRVHAGETLLRIAHRHGVSVEQIAALNPGLDPDRLREGTELVIGEGDRSESVGEPGAGWIREPSRLGPHDAYVLRDPERAYATTRTIERLHAGFDALLRDDPRAPRVRVHDLSLRGGGPIDDHHTHQSGRDVDITYYQLEGCTDDAGCPLRAITADQLDVARQWRLLRHWIERGEVEVIYVDHALQAALRREARRQGATDEELAAWFQYPRRPSSPLGLIRHFPNHADHVHVRFACDRAERRCARASHGP